MRRLLLAAIAGLALVAALAAPASAKSISRVGASCSNATAGYALFMEQGSSVTLGFGAGGSGASGTWHVLIVDNGTTKVIDYTSAMGSSWTVSTTRTLPRGFHQVAVTADNLTTGESCTSQINFRN